MKEERQTDGAGKKEKPEYVTGVKEKEKMGTEKGRKC